MLTATNDASNAVVSAGVPFAPGVVRDETMIVLKDAKGVEIARDATVLARWPADGSIRSVLIALRATLGSGAAPNAVYRITWEGPKVAAPPQGLKPNPDGPVTATLPASWYSASEVSGRLVPVSADTRFATYESGIERGLTSMNPPYDSFGMNCEKTAQHRSYYDSPHAFFQRFFRSGNPQHMKRARAEAKLYRQNELRWVEGRSMAVQACQASGWTPKTPLSWDVLRRMLGQGMLDDFLATGDPEAREAVVAMGEAFRRDLPALMNGRENILEVTERNMAWTIMGIAAHYAVEQRPEIRKALEMLVDSTIAWQNRGRSGAFEHDINRPDPEECERGPHGGSPFMTSLLVDALMDYYALTRDKRIPDVVRKVAVWYERDAITSDGRAFRYLWNCVTDSEDDSSTADLNLLIVHVFGAAYALTDDKHWLVFGDKMADGGIRAMMLAAPKQWNQATRSFGRYLGYRAMGLPP
jgi:hypothetical protein